MKKLALFAFLAMVLAVASCTKETPTGGTSTNTNQWETEGVGTPVNATNIDPAIVSFVETHFPEASVLSCNQTEHYYRVILSDNTKVYFTQTFEWVEVNCEHSSIYGFVPETIVPEQITAYVTANYPNQHIDEIEKEHNCWEIELDNNVDLKFDTNFNVVNNGGNGGGNNGGSDTDYPAIETFVSTYFPQTEILIIKAEDDEYEAKLLDGTEISFNLSFEWTHVDCEDGTVYHAVPDELVPAQIAAYITTNFPNQQIEQIEKEPYGWEIELNNGQEIKFDSDFNVIENGGNGGGTNPEYPEINTFIATYFPQTSILKVEVDDHEIEVELTDGTEIKFNFAFEWMSIECEGSGIYGIVPTELVPEQITAYVTANYPNQHIDKIEKKHDGGWEIELSNGIEIEFDSNFNVTHIDD